MSPRSRGSATTSCFDSTYEGLKQALFARGVGVATRFDSTYEGLKHESTADVLHSFRVSTVPMRA